jgi:hypothetical protein
MTLIRKDSSELIKVGKSISITNKLLKEIDSRTITNKQNRIEIPFVNFGLSDRIGFMNELFNGNLESWTDAITQLKGKKDLASAMNLYNELAINYNWNMQDKTVKHFLSFVKCMNKEYTDDFYSEKK